MGDGCGGGGGAGRGYVDGGCVGGGCGEEEEGEEGWLAHCGALVVRSGCGGWRLGSCARTLIGWVLRNVGGCCGATVYV